MAKSLLDSKGVAFTEIEITNNADLRNEMILRSSRHTVPQIFINDTPIGGFDEISNLDANGKLDEILGSALGAVSMCS